MSRSPAYQPRWPLALAIVEVVLVNVAIAILDAGPGGEFFGYPGAALILVGLLLHFVLAIVAIVLHNSPKLCSPIRERQVMLIVKLGIARLFIIGAVILMFMTITPAAGLHIPLYAGAGWLIMLAGSSWSICYALSLRKNGMIGGGLAVLFICSQLVFVLDVLAALVLFFLGLARERSARASTNSKGAY